MLQLDLFFISFSEKRLSIVRVVWMCVSGVLVWTWVTDYSVSLCECVLCACLNSVRYATNDFCLHKTGFRTWVYIASRMFKWCFDRQRASTLKSVSSYARPHSLFAAKWQAIADGKSSAGFSRFLGGRPRHFFVGSRAESKMCLGTCSLTHVHTSTPFTHIHTTLNIDNLVFTLRCVYNRCSWFVLFRKSYYCRLSRS